MILPNLQYEVTKNKLEVMAMSSINLSDNFEQGDIADSNNISPRRYPYFAPCKKLKRIGNYASAKNLATWGNKLAVVDGTNLYYDGVLKGTLSNSEKQFAVVNTKVVIWPDKKYYDMTTGTLNNLGAEVTVSSITFTEDTFTVSGVNLASYFKVDDGITISGLTTLTGNNTTVTVKSVTATQIEVTTLHTFTQGTESGTIKIGRYIPDMDFICESENRLWGCSSTTQTIYASALGDPTNFNVFENTANDSYAVAVGSNGNFTACTKYSSSVLFWKEDKLHKLLGSFPSEYTIYTYDIEGVEEGSFRSTQSINQTLYYKGAHGIFAYGGGIPTLITTNFGNEIFSNARAGEDGDTYYVSMKQGNNNFLFSYDTVKGIWTKERSIYCNDFATIGNTLYCISDNKVYEFDDTQNAEDTWMVKFKPFYETIQGRKLYTKLILRAEITTGSYINIYVAQDGKPFKRVAKLVGKTGATSIRLPISRCDKYEIKIDGGGDMAILDLLREVAIGSEV